MNEGLFYVKLLVPLLIFILFLLVDGVIFSFKQGRQLASPESVVGPDRRRFYHVGQFDQ